MARTHLAFLKFHNRAMIKGVSLARPGAATPFERCKQSVRWHYQWIILTDFLPNLIDAAVLQDVRANGRRFYRIDRAPSTVRHSCRLSSPGPPTDGTQG